MTQVFKDIVKIPCSIENKANALALFSLQRCRCCSFRLKIILLIIPSVYFKRECSFLNFMVTCACLGFFQCHILHITYNITLTHCTLQPLQMRLNSTHLSFKVQLHQFVIFSVCLFAFLRLFFGVFAFILIVRAQRKKCL